MISYFSLKKRLIQRAMKEYGVNPILCCVLLLALFITLSILLFLITDIASYFYVVIALFFVLKLSESRRNDFLRSCFPVLSYFKIRCVENLLVISPFIVFLAVKFLLTPIIILLIISVIFVFMRFNKLISITIPTPFHRYPYEFCVGFRYSFIAIFFAYFCTIMAIIHDNFGLGFFSLILLFFVIFSFYLKLEPSYYIWSFAMTPSKFIFSKIKTAWFYSTLLILPVFLTLSIYSPRNIPLLLLIMILGCVYIATAIVAKYSTFPQEIGISETIVIIVSFFLPLMLIATIPMFYTRSVQELNRIMK